MTFPIFLLLTKLQSTWRRVIHTWKPWDLGGLAKTGYVVGYAFAVDGWRGYFPVGHEGGGNIDKRLVENFVRRTLELPNTKVMHNAAYDMGWLLSSGFKVNGRIIDTMLAAPLIDENRFSFSLNALGFDYLKEVKSEQGLKEAAGDFNVHAKKELLEASRDVRGRIRRAGRCPYIEALAALQDGPAQRRGRIHL